MQVLYQRHEDKRQISTPHPLYLPPPYINPMTSPSSSTLNQPHPLSIFFLFMSTPPTPYLSPPYRNPTTSLTSSSFFQSHPYLLHLYISFTPLCLPPPYINPTLSIFVLLESTTPLSIFLFLISTPPPLYLPCPYINSTPYLTPVYISLTLSLPSVPYIMPSLSFLTHYNLTCGSCLVILLNAW